MHVFVLLLLIICTSCNLVPQEDIEKIIGTWHMTEYLDNNATIITEERTTRYGSDGSYYLEIIKDGSSQETMGTYKVGFVSTGAAITIFSDNGTILTNALFFRFNVNGSMETSLNANFEQSRLWTR